MWVIWPAMSLKVWARPISRNVSSPVAANCRMADPYTKPWVHSVQPLDAYFPAIVNTGEPCAGSQVFSMEWIFAAEAAHKRSSLGDRSRGFREVLISIMCLGSDAAGDGRRATADQICLPLRMCRVRMRQSERAR